MPSKKSTAKTAAAAPEELIPGAPGVEPPTVAEPTKPRAPWPPKPDQRAPAVVSATGAVMEAPERLRAQEGSYLTTAQGVRVGETAADILAAAGCPTDVPGIVLTDTPTDVVGQLTTLVGTHRVWERFPTRAG